MALPPIPDFNPNQPIPNPPFNTPETSYFVGPYYNANIVPSSGLTINTDGTITVTGGGGVGTVTSVSGTTPISVANGSTTPVISVSAASLAAPGVVQLSDSVSSGSSATAATSAAVLAAYTLAQSASTAATNSLQTTGGTMTGPITFAAGQTFPISGLPNSSTSQVGLVQLNDTLTSTSTTEALTANQGRLLSQQISALTTASNITLAGTFDASLSKMTFVTSEAAALPGASAFVLNANLPAPDANNNNYFALVTVPGTYSPPGGGGPYNLIDGDWLLSNGLTYEYLAVGFTAPYASTSASGVVQLATNLQTQTGTDGTVAVTPASLQSKVSSSTSLNSTTSIASSAAVKSAYDIAVAAQTAGTNAVPKSLYALKGDILGGTAVAGTPQALALGAPGQVLTVNAASPTGLAWTTPAPLGVTNVATGTGLTGGPITSTGTIALANTTVVSGTYNYATLVVDAQGRLTCAVSGAAPNTTVTVPLANTGTAGAPILCINSATTSDCGAVRLATTAEAATGTSQTIALTPLSVASNYIACSQLSVKGSLLTRSSTGVVALPTGGVANNGKVLTINDSCAEGLEWKATAVSGGTVTSVSAGTGLCTSNALNAPITVSGTICLTNTGVTAGTYTYTALTVDAQGRLTAAVSCAAPNTTVTAPITNTGTAVAPVIGISCATTTALGAVQVGSNVQVAAGVISVNSATTAQPGVVQLNDTTSSTSTTLALTAAQGKVLQDQINALGVSSNLTLGGTFDASVSPNGVVVTVTAQGTAAGLVAGSPLPAAAAATNEIFVIVETQGSFGPPTTPVATPPYHVGDWFLSSTTAWQLLNVGTTPTYATTSTAGTVCLSTNALTLAGTDTQTAVVPSALQAKMSDATNVTCSQQIASSTAVKAAFDQANTKIACSLLTTTGDLIYASAANTPARLGIGTNGQVLTISGGIPSWGSPAGTPVATCSSFGTVLGCTLGGNTTLGCLAGSGSASGNTVAIGFQAGCAIAGAFSNTLIGWNAATSLTCGNNTAIGVCALKSATTGTFNIAIGENSGGTLTIGCCNILLGNFASLNTTGTANLILGNNACANGNCNVAIGTNIQIGAGNCQLAIGYDSNKCWLTGNSANAIKPAAGIIDCANVCGAAGQVLMSNGANAVCWASVPNATHNAAGVVLACTTVTASGANTALGSNALAARTTGGSNVAIGHGTGLSITTGNSNVLVGAGSGESITTGSLNTFIGTVAGYNTTTGCKNVMIGNFAAPSSATASCELAIGYDTFGCCWLTGCPTLAIRPGAGIIDCAGSCGTNGQVLLSRGNAIQWGSSTTPTAEPNVSGTVFGYTQNVLVSCQGNTALGQAAGSTLFSLRNTAGSGCKNVFVGFRAGTAAQGAASGNIFIGVCSGSSGANSQTGNNNTIIGNEAGCNLTTGNCNIAIGQQAGACNLSGDANLFLGNFTGRNITTACLNVAIGFGVCLPVADNNSQLAIGYGPTSYWLSGNCTGAIKPGAGVIDCANSCGTAGQVLFSNGANAIRWCSIPAATPTSLGLVCGAASDPLTGIVALGPSALKNATGSLNTAVGVEAGCLISSGTENTLLGAISGEAITTGSRNVAIGFQAGGDITTGEENVMIGYGTNPSSATASCELTIGRTGGNWWLKGCPSNAIRPSAGIIDCAGSCGTAGQVLMSNGANAVCWGTAGGGSAATPLVAGVVLGCTAGSNAGLGCCALKSLTTGNGNTAVGVEALCALTSGNGNTAVGNQALFCATTGGFNTAVGIGALNSVTFGAQNVGIGFGTSPFLTSGSGNVTVGTNAGYNNTSAANNVGIGTCALFCNTGGLANTAVGSQALLCTTGQYNTGLGCAAGCAITVGNNNVAIGYFAQVASPTLSCQLAIGFSATDNWLTGNSTRAIRPGAGIIDCANACGTAGQVLMSTGANAVCWGTAPSGIPCSCITAKGSLISGTAASTPTALAVGTNGQVLVANSLCATGLAWSNTITGICSASYYRQVSAATAVALDWSTEAYKTLSNGAASTISFTNPPANGVVGMMTLQLAMTGGSITWPAAVKWPGGTAPTLTVGRTHLIMFSTQNGGTTILGSYLVDYTV